MGLPAVSVGASPAGERVGVADPVLPAVHVAERQLALVAPGEVSVLVRALRCLSVAVERGRDVALVHLALDGYEVLRVGETLAGVASHALAQVHAPGGHLRAAHGDLELELAAPRVRHVVDRLPRVRMVEVGAALPEVRHGAHRPAALGERGRHGDARRGVERALVLKVVAGQLHLRGGRAVVGVDDAGACALLGHAVHDVLAPAPLEVLPHDAVALLKVREARDCQGVLAVHLPRVHAGEHRLDRPFEVLEPVGDPEPHYPTCLSVYSMVPLPLESRRLLAPGCRAK